MGYVMLWGDRRYEMEGGSVSYMVCFSVLMSGVSHGRGFCFVSWRFVWGFQ